MSIITTFTRALQSSKHDDTLPYMSAADHIKRIEHFVATHQPNTAYEACKQALILHTDNVDILALLTNMAIQHHYTDEAIDYLTQLITTHPHAANLHYYVGQLLFEQHHYAAAVESFQKAIAYNPTFAKAHNNNGAALQILGQMDAALHCFKKAFELDPTLWIASRNIGNIYKLIGRLEEAVMPFQIAMMLRRQFRKNNTILNESDSVSTRSKLIHDIEQLDYLMVQHPEKATDHEQAKTALTHALHLMEPYFTQQLVHFPEEVKKPVAPYFNRLLHFYNAPTLKNGALNKNQDWQKIEADYAHNTPGMIYIDNFLTPEALLHLRRFCMESTIWFDYLYHNGYVGCTCEDGFICPLLTQITEETRLAMPSIFGDNTITGLWGYKYDSQRGGIAEHADFAAVNANFWITPDTANLDANSGGLIIWDKEAPIEWNFDDFNENTTNITEFLIQSQAKPFIVPYKENRIAIFNSDLFHKTDSYHFKTGYENRRVNITMLYGYRK